jgi:hypothetical protein
MSTGTGRARDLFRAALGRRMAGPVAHASDWSGGGDEIARRDHALASRETFMVHLDRSHHAELRHAVDALTAALGPEAAAGVGEEGEPSQEVLGGVTADTFPLEPPRDGNMRAQLAGMWSELVDGAGLVLLNKIPLDAFTPAEIALIYVGIGAHLGTAIPQSDELGDVLGFVKPAEGAMAVRGYRNTADQALHTDGTVDFVGMLCVRPAEGAHLGQGLSRYSSCTAAYNDIVRQDPDLLPTLFRGFRYHLGENTAVVWDDSVPTITPNRVPVLSWGPRILGEAGGASKDSLESKVGSANQKQLFDGTVVDQFFDDGVSEPQDMLGGGGGDSDGGSSAYERRPDGIDCVNVRYLRSYIDDAAYELTQGVKLNFDDASSKVRARPTHPVLQLS